MSTGDFRVADISLADFGRKEIELAEHEVKYFNLFAAFKLSEIDAWTYGLPS